MCVFAIFVTAYPWFYFNITKSINFLSEVKILKRRNFSECDAGEQLKAREFRHCYNIKMATAIPFPFYAFSLYRVISRNSTSAYNEIHLY